MIFIFPESESSLEMEEEEHVNNELSHASVGMAGTSDATPNTSGATLNASGAEPNTSGAEPNTSCAEPTKAGHAHIHRPPISTKQHHAHFLQVHMWSGHYHNTG